MRMNEEPNVKRAPRWMAYCLLVAGVYNLLWGTFVVLFPMAAFRWMNIPPPNYPSIWQCVGMIVGVYGIGYVAAARDPLRHWPIVLVGLLGKICGPLGFAMTAARGELPWSLGWTILTNDLIWWLPFALILIHAHRARCAPADSTRIAHSETARDPTHNRHD